MSTSRSSCDNMDMEEFIKIVRSHELLWNVSNVRYIDTGAKDITWETVSKQCGMDNGKEAKRIWKRLKDCHREALRRRRNIHNKEFRCIKPWKYEEAMQFLVDGGQGETSNKPRDSFLVDVIQPDDQDDDQSQPEIESAQRMYEYEARSESPRSSDTAMSSQRKRKLSNDALSYLFSSMCEKTRALPRRLQLRVQREVFEAVTRAEEEALGFNAAAPASSNNAAPLVIKTEQD